MRDGSDLLYSLHARGVTVVAENGQLRIRAPKGRVLPEHLHELSARKSEIIALLEQSKFPSTLALEPRTPGCQVPLTVVQQCIWNAHERSGNFTSTAATSFAVRVHGPLDTCRLQESIGALVERHESLRTRFFLVNGIPTQHVDPPFEYKLDVISLPEAPHTDRNQELERTAGEFAHTTVDLSVGPLFVAKLLKLSDCDHVLILAMDHMISDGVSLQILDREIWTLYQQAANGFRFALPPQPVQLGDYAVWQQRTRDAWMTTHGAYWTKRLSGASSVQLPFDTGGTEPANSPGAMLHLPFGDALSTRLHEAARRERTLVASVVLTIYVAVISQWCNTDELLIMSATNGRFCSELVNAIGLFSFPQPLRITMMREDTFHDLLTRIDKERESANTHLDFGRAIEIYGKPLGWDLAFNWAPINWAQGIITPQRAIDSGVTVRPFPLRRPVDAGTRFASIFSCTDGRITMSVVCRSDLLSTAEWFGHNLRAFAEEFTWNALRRIASVSLRPKSSHAGNA